MGIKEDKWDVEFSVRRSCRYHASRKAHFEFLHKVSTFIIIVLSSGSFLAVICFDSSNPPAWIALLITLIATGDLVIGFSSMATKHELLYRKFNELLIKIDSVPPNENLINDWKAERLRIQSEESAIYKALDVSCHNDECRASRCDKGEFVPMTKKQAFLKNWFKFTNVDWKTVDEIKAEKPANASSN